MEDFEKYERFVETGEGIVVYRLENMPCPRCRFGTGEVSACDKYYTKPFAVMQGRADCPKFEPKPG